jgi:UDP-N-acetylmuramoyl-tripeptide--D-alanyl-D-alanine ligase
MKFSLDQLAGALDRKAAALEVAGYSIDTRTLAPGDLFFALRGPNHDGHDYLRAAAERGAVAAVAERAFAGLPTLVTPDSQEALERLAAWARSEWSGTVVGITGSAGKTTTKEVIAQLLSVEMPVGKTVGNLNNHVGLPLSILRLPDQARVAALEIGMNHPGEIRRLAGIARPEIAVVTNVGFAHAEYFNSVDEVALAKRELVEALPPDGIAVLNADDPRVAAFRDVHPGRVVTFGMTEEADVHPDGVQFGAEGVCFRLGGVDFTSSLAGRHGLSNLLAGIAVAGVFGIEPARLREAVGAMAPPKMRGERFVRDGVTIWNDCYNANPEAMRAMLDVLGAAPARRRIAVLGEMLELGRWTEPLHRDVGRYAARCGINVLVGIRGAAVHMVDEATRFGLPAGAAVFFEDPAEAGAYLRGLPEPGDAVLFKGSRGTQVEVALEKFLAPS